MPGTARPERDRTASAREARPGVCSWTFAGRPPHRGGRGPPPVSLSRHARHTDAMRTAHSWRRWWPAVMAAVILCGLWALTLAAPDEPARFVAARTQAAPDSLVGMVRPAPDAAPALPPPAAANASADLPPGVSREQWAAIEAEVGQRPDAPA